MQFKMLRRHMQFTAVEAAAVEAVSVKGHFFTVKPYFTYFGAMR